jgi:hypothetical protein
MAASPPPAFVHLHVHSSYSLSEGAIKADKLAALARDAGMPAVALTDTANLFGALEFSQACAAKGVQPIMGCQLWLGREHLEGRGASGGDPERNAPDRWWRSPWTREASTTSSACHRGASSVPTRPAAPACGSKPCGSFRPACSC